MARWIGMLTALAILLGLSSCPVPVRKIADTGRQEYGAPAGGAAYSQAEAVPEGGAAAPAAADPAAGQLAADAAGAVGPDAPDATQASPAALPVGPQPPGADASQQTGPYPPADNVGPQLPQAPSAPGAGQTTQPVGPVQPQAPAPQYGALDAENFMGDAPVQTVWGQAKPKLSEDALSFAGRWLVAVVHRQGEARMLENGAEWVLELGRDGSFYAKQNRDGQEWRQSGTWELSGMQLLLHSGPGGERSYELSQEMENVCVLRDAEKETALFCVRDDASARPAAVQAKYDTDFGLLNLRPAGPGHWRGSYGEPSGTLLLAQLGRFLVGTWEQAPSKGFVLLEIRDGGFAGAWLYQTSVYFDGRWVGVAAH